MHISAEIRFFWEKAAPKDLEEWFSNEKLHNGINACARQTRTDIYLCPSGYGEVGIKKRDSQPGAEVKGMVMRGFADLATEPFAGPVDLWTKWICEPLELNESKTIAVSKTRLIRTFDTYSIEPIEEEPRNKKYLEWDRGASDSRLETSEGCVVELTKITIESSEWWSFGFESFGSMKRVASSLKSVATLLSSRQAPKLSGGIIASYPEWLSRL
jgi:hypothetical protein